MTTENTQQTYRERLYANYGKTFQDAGQNFSFEQSKRWGRAYNWYLRGWLPSDKTASIVDLACGAGRLLHFFKEHGYLQVEGVDISPDQVNLERQVVQKVTQGDVIAFLEANAGRFDLITGLDIVEHFQKNEVLQFLDAAFAALKPNGRLVLQTPNAGGLWNEHRYSDITHETGFNVNSLRRLMAATGFQNIEPRELGPPPKGYSLLSSIRFILWQCIRLQMKIWNYIETGGSGDGIFTRVFLISGVKPTE